MVTISPDPTVTTVIARLEAQPTLLARLSEHARAGLERFSDYPGFLGGALGASLEVTVCRVTDCTLLAP